MCSVRALKASAVNSLVLILSVAILMAQPGCATTKNKYPPPLPKETRERLGRIGVACADTQPQIWLGQKPLGKGEGAWQGTKKGAGAMLNLAGESARGGNEIAAVFVVFFFVLSVFAGATGLVVGAAKGVSEEDVKKAEADMARVLPQLKIQESMRAALLDAANKEKSNGVVAVELTGPDVLYMQPDYERLAHDGIDSLIRIGVEEIRFSGENAINPDLQFGARVLVRIDNVKDGTQLYNQVFIYNGETRKFCEWAEDDARPLREEFDKFYKQTAEDIAGGLFIR